MILVNAWEFLGIGPTMDVKVIKRAYARKLRDAHPEDEIEAFQALQEAYKAALQEAKYLSSIAEGAAKEIHAAHSEHASEQSTNIDNLHTTSIDQVSVDQVKPTLEQTENIQQLSFPEWFMGQIHILYHDYNARTKLENWQYMLSFEEVHAFEYYPIISESLWEYLKQLNQLPQPVLRLLEEQFNWLQQKDSVHSSDADDHDFYDYYYYLVTRPWSYDFPELPDDINPDAFIFSREKARQALAQNDLNKAEHNLNEALALFANDFDVLRLYGEYLNRVGQLREAGLIYERLATQFPYDEAVMLQYGNFLMQEKRIKEAMKLYQNILIQNSDCYAAMTGIALCYENYGQLEEAKALVEMIIDQNEGEMVGRVMLSQFNKQLIQQYQQRIQENPFMVQLKYKLAELYYDANLFEYCCDLLSEIEKEKQANSASYLLWGRAMYALEKNEASLDFLNTALTLANEEGVNGYQIKVMRGEVLESLSFYQEAIVQLNEVLKMNPADTHVLYLLGESHGMLNQYEQAVEYCTKAIQLHATNWLIYFRRGLSRYYLKQYAEAIADMDYVVSQHRFSDISWHIKGHCYMYLEQYDKAVYNYERAIDYLSNEMAYYNLACAYVKLEDYSAALTALDKFIKVFSDLEGYLLKGDIYRAIGNFDEAYLSYNTAVELYPNSYIAVKRLVYAYMEFYSASDENDSRMLGLMKAILEDYPWDAWMIIHMIHILMNQQNWKEANTLSSNLFYECEDGVFAKELCSFYSGITYFHRGNAEEAYFWFQYAMNAEENPLYLMYMSMTCFQLKKNKEALLYGEQALKLAPERTKFKEAYEIIKQANVGGVKKLFSKLTGPSADLFEMRLIEEFGPLEIDSFHIQLLGWKNNDQIQ